MPMGARAVRYAGLAVVLLLAGIGGGYVAAMALDDDDDPATTSGTSTTEPTEPGSTSGPGAGASEGTAVVIAPVGVVGWWVDGAWVRPSAGRPPVVGGERYTLVGPEGALGTAVGGELGVTCEISEPYPAYVELDPPFEAATDSGLAPIAVSGVEDPSPRDVEALDGRSDTYRRAAGDALATVGIDDRRPTITQLLRTDLDGDGSDEVLITVARLHKGELLQAKPGDYSAVILRRVVDGEVRSQVLEHFLAEDNPEGGFSYLLLHRVAAIADLNGDGELEVAIDDRYYEGSAVNVFADDGSGRLVAVIGTGCGV